MLASLLAASLASNRGRVGCTRMDWLMNAGLAVPRGSSPWSARPFAMAAGPNGESIIDEDADCAKGCGELAVVAECNGDWNAALLGVTGALFEGASGEGV